MDYQYEIRYDIVIKDNFKNVHYKHTNWFIMAVYYFIKCRKATKSNSVTLIWENKEPEDVQRVSEYREPLS